VKVLYLFYLRQGEINWRRKRKKRWLLDIRTKN